MTAEDGGSLSALAGPTTDEAMAAEPGSPRMPAPIGVERPRHARRRRNRRRIKWSLHPNGCWHPWATWLRRHRLVGGWPCKGAQRPSVLGRHRLDLGLLLISFVSLLPAFSATRYGQSAPAKPKRGGRRNLSSSA